MIRDPYISGVERFEAPVDTFPPGQEPHLLQKQAAHFCILAWNEFASELRLLRYSVSFDQQPDTAVEWQHLPQIEELHNFDLHQANQIDLEFISQHAATQNKHKPMHPTEEDYFPAFLEIFIPLAPPSPKQAAGSIVHSKRCLVIWCRPTMIKQVFDLWGRAAILSLAPA
ncbi:MAG TPA: hypothetical protein VH540_17195 [Ktedonobacterales bacterium]